MNDLKLWDAHAHIQSPWFSSNEIQKVIQTAVDSNIEGIINVVSTPNITAYQEGIELKAKNKIVHLNFGLQPTDSSTDTFMVFKDAVSSYKNDICAIGEVGLDYHWVKDINLQQIQKDVFLSIIELSNELKFPLVIHSRKAENNCLDILEKHSQVPVLLHGIEANLDQIKRIIDLNYSITLPTSVCNRKKYRKIALRTPLERILLETDSPFQLPFEQPKDNKIKIKNEPANILKSAQKLAELKDLDIAEVGKITRRNTLNFFNL